MTLAPDRKDDLDKTRFPYDDVDKFRDAVTLTEPQDSLVAFLRPFANVCYILRYKYIQVIGILYTCTLSYKHVGTEPCL